MNQPSPGPRRPALGFLVGTIAVLVCLVAAGSAAAASSPHFRRGHLPSIGEIKLVRTKSGHAVVTVPVAYTQALSGSPAGLESSEVTLHVARKVKHGRAVGVTYTRVHRHHILGTAVVVDRFRLDRRTSHWLLGRGRKERGRLVRVDVRHRIAVRHGERPLHEKDASITMASSHRARPQGETAVLTVRNDTSEPVKIASEPIFCMYTNGEQGSDLQDFTTPEEEPLRVGGTIEAEVQASGNLFDAAEWQGSTGQGAGHWLDWQGVAADELLYAFDIELTPIFAAFDFAKHCDVQASTFMEIAANPSGSAGSSEGWVLTSETCSHGCVHTNLPTAMEALGVQTPDGYGPGEWSEASTEILQDLVGGWREPPVGGKAIQDQGLHWVTQELPEVEEEHLWGLYSTYTKAFELSIHPGSSPAGYSG
ncbi:MAG TPA: hypothetical protein VHA76_05275 [Solirubrobacterales bacterium]|nr:hypothetical protein [Solirubrobacterales bacterium]